MGRVLSGKHALEAQRQFDFEKNQVALEMLEEFRAILETLGKDGKITKGSFIRVLIRLKKLPKEKTKEFFENFKNMSDEERRALLDEARSIVQEVKETTSEKQLIKSRIKTKKRILEKQQEMEPMFEKFAGKKANTSRIFEKLVENKVKQEEVLSV